MRLSGIGPLLVLAAIQASAAPEPQAEIRIGRWVASGSHSDALRSVVELYVNGEVMSGRIERVIDKDGKEVDAVCHDCRGDLKNRRMKGIVFISGLRRKGSKWVNGSVVNLEPGLLIGVTANCEIEIKNGTVEFYGFRGIRFFGTKSTWQPYVE